jgi:serine/arginine repetitive matrix protein 1
LISLLEASTDPKEIQIQMTGFLEESTFKFMKNLWELVLSAQTSLGGIPQSFLDAKKEEIKKQRVHDFHFLFIRVYLGKRSYRTKKERRKRGT